MRPDFLNAQSVCRNAALTFTALLTASMALQAALVTIDNTRTRYDTNGELLDAHDGSVCRFDSTYYLYGSHYNNQDGTTAYNGVCCYGSPDMVHWTNHGEMLPERLAPGSTYHGLYWRPHAIYNKRTGKYVLFGNWGYLAGGERQLFIYAATADHPWGPFAIQNILRGPGVVDFCPLVDDDGSAYIIGRLAGRHSSEVLKLKADYIHEDSTFRPLQPPFDGDGWIFFKRDGIYYGGCSDACYYCGYPTKFYRSSSPGGPWTKCTEILNGQGMFVAEVATPSGIQYLFIGDLWWNPWNGVGGGCKLGFGCSALGFGPPFTFNNLGCVVAPAIAVPDSFSIDVLGLPSPGPRAPKNYALGKTVTASSSLESGRWSKNCLTDWREFSDPNYTSMGWRSDSTGSNHTEWVQIDLDTSRNIGAVALYPKVRANKVNNVSYDDPDAGEGFPKSFSIKLSQDNSNWTTAGQVTNLPNPKSIPQKISFAATQARYARVEMTDLATVNGRYVAQLTEVKVLAAADNVTAMRTPYPSICRKEVEIRAIQSGPSALTIRGSLPREGRNDPCRLTVYDMRGRLVRSLTAASVGREFAFTIRGLAQGRYLCVIVSGNATARTLGVTAR